MIESELKRYMKKILDQQSYSVYHIITKSIMNSPTLFGFQAVNSGNKYS